MKNILWVSMFMPYDKVRHASGKIENYYMKALAKQKNYNVHLLTMCKPEEISQIDLDEYGITYDYAIRPRGGLQEIKRIYSWLTKLYIWNKYAGLTPYDISHGIKKLISKLATTDYEPDIIIMDWTEILFLMPELMKIWPQAKYVAIEEDVSFLGQIRKAQGTKNPFIKAFFSKKAKRVEKIELEYLKQCDLIILNNYKDKELICENESFDNIWVWSPYYQTGMEIQPQNHSNEIVYYGAMHRPENWKSAIWFIKNVYSKIDSQAVKFVIIGNNPPKQLTKYQSDRIVIKGFVDDIHKELSSCLCLVAPLLLGAGVKIKIIESLSIGIPVLTNDIGIEGIPAVDGESFFYCKSPEDYIKVINQLLENKINREMLVIKAKEVVKRNFDFANDPIVFMNKLEEL